MKCTNVLLCSHGLGCVGVSASGARFRVRLGVRIRRTHLELAVKPEAKTDIKKKIPSN